MRPLGRGAAVVVFFAALTVVFTWPLSAQPGARALGLDPDARLFLWTLSWDVHALTTAPARLFHANIFHPAPYTLAYSEHLVGSALVAAPFILATGNPLLGLNMVVLIACAACGAGTYLLARAAGLGRAGAIAAGLVFAFAPPRFFRLTQAHLAPVQWIPLALAALHAYVRRPGPAPLRLAAFLFTLQALTSGHGGLFLACAIALFLAWGAAARRLPAPRIMARHLGVPGLVLLLANAPFVWPYLKVRQQGLERSLDDARAWSPNAASFLASPTHAHRALLSPFRSFRKEVLREARSFQFPGVLPLVLAAVALARRRRHGPPALEAQAFYVLLTGLSLWAALGPDAGLYRLLFAAVPGFDMIRVPSRLTLLTVLGLAVLAGAGLERVLAGLPEGRRRAAAALALALLAGEFAAFPLDAPRAALAAGDADRWLATQPGAAPIVELPVPDPRLFESDVLQSTYMLHSTLHFRPTANGYSGFQPGSHEALFRRLAAFPSEESLAALAPFGVRTLVVHGALFGEQWPEVRARLDGLVEGGRLARTFVSGDDAVYELRAP